jgi:hypothetical protein
MSEPKEKTRYGVWAATGVYRWFAFSESPDDEKFPCLGLRKVSLKTISLNLSFPRVFFYLLLLFRLRSSRVYPVRIAVGSSKLLRAKEMKPRFGGAVILADVRVVVAVCAANASRNVTIKKFPESG